VLSARWGLLRGRQLLRGAAQPLNYHTPVVDGLLLAYAACLENCTTKEDVAELDGWVTVTAAQAVDVAADEQYRRQAAASRWLAQEG
jgi:hypothetical protein